MTQEEILDGLDGQPKVTCSLVGLHSVVEDAIRD
jgi:hypothetical protein